MKIEIPEGVRPVAIWDPNTPGGGWDHNDCYRHERMDWADAHGFEDAGWGAFYVLDGVPVVVVRRVDPAPVASPPFLLDPETVVLDTLPPDHLLRQSPAR